MMNRLPAIALALTIVATSQPAFADPLAYVRTSSQYQRDRALQRYHPLNLLDDDASSMWCEGADGLGEGEEIRFFFKKSTKIDRIIIGPASGTGRRVLEVRVTDGTNVVRVELGSQYAERPLQQPLKGTTFTVTIDQVGPKSKTSDLPADVACLSDVLLFYRNRPFNGRTPLSRLRFDKMKDRVLGRWSGEPMGAPESFIVFALDGTWEWTHTPLLGGRSERRRGEYRFRGNRLLMRRGETGRWSDVAFKHKRVKVDPDEIGAPLGDYDLIVINGALGDKLAGEYNNAEF